MDATNGKKPMTKAELKEKRLNLLLPKELKERLTLRAQSLGVKLPQYVRMALKVGMNELDKVGVLKETQEM